MLKKFLFFFSLLIILSTSASKTASGFNKELNHKCINLIKDISDIEDRIEKLSNAQKDYKEISSEIQKIKEISEIQKMIESELKEEKKILKALQSFLSKYCKDVPQ
ncbi:hypothetical protein Noda2021_04590 [Candidatus Dependentiae bacterium Noda2021]|nr:hypothetical protein Noda2021_04590 [Candidatus Dependentiae bacterium Noda2021]